MGAQINRGLRMTFTPTAIVLIAVLTSGYVLAVAIGTMAYFANEKNY
ncbi:MAG: hypothetical protein RLZZ04_1659 [Cyanobacteriota bacterium]|jgi:hypothetical protein